MKYKFLKPVSFEGKNYDEIELDLDGMSSADVEAVYKQINTVANSDISFTPNITWKYFAARAAKLPVEFFTSMPDGRDYMRIGRIVENFFGYMP
ncbi:phage tail assembly protein [Turicimonas sp. TL08]